MSVYPPSDQILSSLGVEVAWRDENTLVGRTLVDTGLLGRNGDPPGMGALSPIVDIIAGSRATRDSNGGWLVTSDLWMHQRAPLGLGPLLFETRMLRAGKRSMVVEVEVLSDGRPAASCTVEFSHIRRDASQHRTNFEKIAGQWVRIGSGDLLDRPLEEACAFRTLDDPTGVVEVERSPFVANSIGTLQGGVVVLLADAAASAALGPAARTIDMQFRFLAQTGDGPARATAEILRSDRGEATVRVSLVDRADDKLVGWSICRVVSEG